MATATYALSAQYQLELVYSESGTSTPANTSTVPITLQIRKLSGSGYYQAATSYWNIEIDGVSVASGSIGGYDFTLYTVLTLGSFTATVTHLANGTKSITITGTFGETVSNIGSGTASSGTFVLTNIPRGPDLEFNGAWAQGLVNVEFNGAWVAGLAYAEYNGAWELVA